MKKDVPQSVTCKQCGVERVGKTNSRASRRSAAKKELCRLCGLRSSMEKRNQNMEWKEKLSVASKGKEKSIEHKKAMSISAKKRIQEIGINAGLIKYQQDKRNSPNSWTMNKRFCLERDGGRCRHCGTNKKIQVHHMNPYKKSKNNHVDNLITLCSSCHIHAEEIRMPEKTNKDLCGILLAGGRGTRLAPNSVFHNKHEMPLGPVPMIFYPLMTLRSLRVTNIMVILDRKNIGRIMEMLGDGSEFGVKLSYKVQNSSGGIAEALLLAKDFAKGKKSYVILGDNIFQKGEFDRPTKFYTDGCVFLKEIDNPVDYGVAEIKGERVIGIEEKPQAPKTNLAVTGLYVYNKDVFPIIESLEPSKRDELEISSLNDYLAKKGQLSYKIVKGTWLDAGYSHEGYVKAQVECLNRWVEELK